MKAYSYIRFSTAIQKEGDSERRQKEASEKYVKDHGLILDTSINMQDSGKSAYHGVNVNRTKGALGAFLKYVEDGKIAKGSFLLVENLDRLSRQEVLEALNQFTSIIQAGITIVTLQDGIEYTQESINANFGQLLMSIVYMSQAHQESEKKSIRLKASWESKRQNSADGKNMLTGRVPQWIEVTEDKKLILIPDVCKAIKLIYQKKLSGIGNDKIVREMNSNPDVWKPLKSKRNKTGGWQNSTVGKILSNRQLVGEYQPCKMIAEDDEINKKRVKEGKSIKKRGEVGELIKNYFPKAIDESLFFQVQKLIHDNGILKGNSGGKTGKATNIFAHVVQCGICKGAMHYIDKGQSSKGGQYLHCDNSRRKKEDQCTAKPIHYKEFEKLFFDEFEELDINQLIPDDNDTNSRITEIEKILNGNEGKIFEIENNIKNLVDTITHTPSPKTREIYDLSLNVILTNKESLLKQNEELSKEKVQLTNQKRELLQNVDLAKEIYSLLDSAKDEDERINIRLRLRSEIKKLVEWIRIYPLQEDYETLKYLKSQYNEAHDLIQAKKVRGEKIGMGLKTVIADAMIDIRRIENNQDAEDGIVKRFDSKYIDRVRIKFRGSGNIRSLFLLHYVDPEFQ